MVRPVRTEKNLGCDSSVSLFRVLGRAVKRLRFAAWVSATAVGGKRFSKNLCPENPDSGPTVVRPSEPPARIRGLGQFLPVYSYVRDAISANGLPPSAESLEGKISLP